MFYSLTGQLVMTNSDSFAVNCNGVAFQCFSSLQTLKDLYEIGSEITVYTHMNVRDDAITLYGFSTVAELETFQMITTVSGIGPKVGIAILSEFTPDELAMSILAEDVKNITRAPGVGPKTAKRMILELRDKIEKTTFSTVGIKSSGGSVPSFGRSTNAIEAIEALVSLGYSQTQASTAVHTLDLELPAEDLIRGALKNLAGQAR